MAHLSSAPFDEGKGGRHVINAGNGSGGGDKGVDSDYNMSIWIITMVRKKKSSIRPCFLILASYRGLHYHESLWPGTTNHTGDNFK